MATPDRFFEIRQRKREACTEPERDYLDPVSLSPIAILGLIGEAVVMLDRLAADFAEPQILFAHPSGLRPAMNP